MPQKRNKEQRVGISVRRLLHALIPIFFVIAIRRGGEATHFRNRNNKKGFSLRSWLEVHIVILIKKKIQQENCFAVFFIGSCLYL